MQYLQAWFFIVSQFEFKIIAKRINIRQFGIRDVIFESHWPISHLLYVALTRSWLKTFKDNIFYSKPALWILKDQKVIVHVTIETDSVVRNDWNCKMSKYINMR